MEEHIVIDFERTGGFSGMIIRTSIDSLLLTSVEATELNRLVTEAGILNMTKKTIHNPSIPDQFMYKLTIRKGIREHLIELTENQVPVSALPLLGYLTAKTRKKR
jgi:hypothetical protein